jgi:NodT family efflux transporter outer membrane factor (OMF) lipoprotein
MSVRARRAAPLALLLLSACTGPLATPRLTPIESQSLGLGAMPAPAIPARWWQAMGDPQLDRIMDDALAGNPGLDMAMARLRQAQAALAERRADTLPQVTVNGQETRTRLSEKYIIPPPYGGSTQWVGQVQADLSWSLDFWGRQAAAVRQAGALQQAAALDSDAARLALTSAVAQTYVELVRAGQVIAIAQARVEERRQAVRLVGVRVRTQLASNIDARAAETELAQAEQALVRAQGQRALAIHALAALAGRGADYYPTIAAPVLRLDQALPLPDALPADLLSRRPDVAAALARIEAARQGQEVARKAFYPNINLIGLIGTQALGLSELFGTSAGTYGAGAAIHLPIFDGGRLRAEHAGATAGVDAAVADYDDHVVRAVKEAADALTRVAVTRDDLAAQRAVAGGLSETRRLDRVRVASGLETRLSIVESELRLLDAQIGVANLEADGAVARIQLLIAVGGDFAAVPPNQPQ